MKKILYILLFLIYYTLNSQSLVLYNVDISNFPTISANLYAHDKDGNQITNLSLTDFELYENGNKRNITKISCPTPKPPEAISSVLVMDGSGSMSGKRLEMSKEAARAWIEGIPLGKSECAITAFTMENFFIQDFTKDKNLLLEKANLLFANGGTDYDAALINPQAGGLLVSKDGFYKKVIVMLTDGMAPVPKISTIVAEANQQNCAIYVVTLDMPCPQSLKDITAQTGGMWFENVTTKEQAREIYKRILTMAQGGEPCKIEWESDVVCEVETRNIRLDFISKGIYSNSEYFLDHKYVAELEIEPPYLSLMNSPPGEKKDERIKVTAKNADFTVNNISSTNPAFFISPTNFHLKAGESIELTVSVIPPDSGYIFTKFEFENELCKKYYYVTGGYYGKAPTVRTLKLIHPNGGEIFVAGKDTVITWEGILPEDYVSIDYSTDNGISWLKIENKVNGLKYKWKIPKTPSNTCIARVTTRIQFTEYDEDMVYIPEGSFIMGSMGRNTATTSEKPVHNVTITRPFLMSKYEVTQKKFMEIMGTNPSPNVGDNLPVERVTWYEAVEYCNKLSEKAGLQPCYSGSGNNIVCDFNANGFRLPTEAEWEYACKAGSTTDIFNGNLTYTGCTPIDPYLNNIAWFCGNSSNRSHIVGQKQVNPFGLYDIIGNVCEWVWDWQGNYTTSDETDPTGPPTGNYKIVRGGSYANQAIHSRSSNRHIGYRPESRHVFGFRVVRTY